jgi:hypothetical protein
VARNDQPLSPKEQKKEEDKLRKSIEERRKETAEQRARRIADWERRRQRQRDPLKELPDAFDFRLAGEEALASGEVYVIDATPKPGYKPKLPSAAYFPKVKARLWIDKNDYHWAKVELETLDTISFGGFLVRLGEGHSSDARAGARQPGGLAAEERDAAGIGAGCADHERSQGTHHHVQRL